MKSTESSIPEQSAGEPLEYDPEFKGPVKERSCTDIICLFLFVSFLAGWLVVAIFSFRAGDPKILIYPADSDGNICGVEPFEDKPHVFFFDIMECAKPSVVYTGCPTPQVCVSECPSETFFVMPNLPESYKSKLICKYDVEMESKNFMELTQSGECAKYYLSSTPLIGRCIPDAFTTRGDDILDNQNKTMETDGQKLTVNSIQKATKFLAKFLSLKQTGEQIFSDFKTSWHWILLFLILSMVVSFIWIIMMRWVAGVMVWASIFLVLGFSAAGCYFSAKKYVELKNVPGSNATITFTTNLNSYLGNRDTWLAFSIITALIFVILFLIILFLRKRLFIAIALIKEASRAVSCMMSSLLFPILPYALQLIIFTFSASVALYIASSGKASFMVTDAPPGSHFINGTSCNPQSFNGTEEGVKCLFQSFGMHNNLYSAHAYNLFALFWGVFFAVGMGQVSLAGAFASYYWTMDKDKDLPRWAVLVGLYRCLRFHLGSVAMGSLIIAVVRMIRAMLEYIDQQCKQYDNQFTKAIMCCMKCCFWCLENVLRFITKNAYIMIAVYGSNFCTSGKRAVKLLWRNVVRTVVIDNVTDFLLFMGKLVVVAIAAATSFYFFASGDERLGKYTPELNFNLIPPLFITFGAYVIASGFFSVYSMAVDTLFLCFLEDCERNDGTPEKPFYMSKELRRILDKKNKLKDPEEK